MQTGARLSATEHLDDSREAVASGILRLLIWAGSPAVVLAGIWCHRTGDWLEFLAVTILYAAVLAALAWRGRPIRFRANLVVWIGYLGGTLQLSWGAPRGRGYQLLLVTTVLAGLLLDPRAARLWCAGIIATVVAMTGAYGLGLVRAADSAGFDVPHWLAHASIFALLALVAFVPQQYIAGRLARTLEDNRRDREELDRIFNLSLDILCVGSMDGTLLRANLALAQLLGYDMKELEGRQFMDFVHPDDAASTRQAMAELSAQGEVLDFTNRWRCRDGSYRWIEWRSKPYEGHLVFSTARDITQRRQVEATAREGEAQVRSIFQAAPIGIGLVANRLLVQVNDRLCEMVGHARDELLGRSARVLYPSDEEFERVGRDKYGQIRQRGTGTVETRWQRKDGVIIDVLLSSTPLDPLNWGAGVTFTAMDITDRKRMEAEAKAEEMRLQALLRISQRRPDSVRNLLDVALEEIVRLSDSQYGYIFHYSEQSRQFTVHAWSAAVMQECTVHGPPHVYDLDATGIWGEAVRQREPIVVNDFDAASPLKKGQPEGHVKICRFMTIPVYSEGHIVAVAGVANKPADYTDADVHCLTLMMDTVWRTIESKRAEDALRESEEKFSRAFHANPAIVSISTLKDSRILDVNEAFEQVTGYRREEILGQGLDRIGIFANAHDRDDLLHSIRTQGWVHNVECRFRAKSGDELIGLVSAERVEIKGEECVLAVTMDITERRNLLEQLRQINAELEQRVRERTAVAEDRAAQLRVLASRLAMAENQERKRVAQILHEHFQQLLVGINFNIGVLRQRLADSSLLGILDQMSETIGETVRVSRTLTVELCPPVLYDMGLAAALEWLGRWMQDHYGLRVEVSADPSANPSAEDTSTLLFHSARELLFNVVKHAQVQLASVRMTRRDRDQVEIVVADEGVGFDPASRLAESGMAGFGLFSIRERIALAGGGMQIDSRPGGGTRITLWAPLQQPAGTG